VPVNNAPYFNDFGGSQTGEGDLIGPVGIADFYEPIYNNRTNYTSPEEFKNKRKFVYEFPSYTNPKDDKVKLTFVNQDWFDETFMTVEYNELGFPTRIIFDKSKMPLVDG
jgi:hypothetical protein